MRVAIIALMVLGCGSDDPPRSDDPPKPKRPVRDLRTASHDDCVAASHGELASPGGTGLGASTNTELRAHREPIILRRCTEDAWPTDAARCFAAAGGLRAIGECLLLLPQSDALTADLQAQMHRDLHLPSP